MAKESAPTNKEDSVTGTRNWDDPVKTK